MSFVGRGMELEILLINILHVWGLEDISVSKEPVIQARRSTPYPQHPCKLDKTVHPIALELQEYGVETGRSLEFTASQS